MSKIDRLVVSRGPALVSFNDGHFFSKGDIVVDLEKETQAMVFRSLGTLTEIITTIKASTRFTPVGEFEHIDVLWQPFAEMFPGTSLYGDTDTPLLIQPLDTSQQQTTFHSAALVRPPGLFFTAQDTLIGQVEFQMIGKKNTSVRDPNYLFTPAANSLVTLPYDPDNLLIQAYDANWVSSWGGFVSREGVKVTFDIQTVEDRSNSIGHFDTIFRDLSVKAMLIPQGVSEAEAINATDMQGVPAVVGSRLVVGSHDFTISTGGGVYFILYGAKVRKAGLVYSAENQRVPEFEWIGNRQLRGGKLTPRFYIGNPGTPIITPPPPTPDFILAEDGGHILTEAGDRIETE